jgi:hypothetical protein
MEHFNFADTAPDWGASLLCSMKRWPNGDADHEAVLLRYFKNQDFRVGALWARVKMLPRSA